MSQKLTSDVMLTDINDTHKQTCFPSQNENNRVKFKKREKM